MIRTTYRVEDADGRVTLTEDAERAERLSRAGLRVEAHTEEVRA